MPTLSSNQRCASHLASVAAIAITLNLSGCGGLSPTQPIGAPSPVPAVKLHGSVHGGQQPISGATILLFAAGTSSYGQPTPNLLTTPVLTDPTGGFNITGDYTCTTGQQMFLIADGGDPGSGPNVDVALMAALGDCSQLHASTFITVNEVTTIGSVFALAPFLPTDTPAATVSNGINYFALGSTSTNTQGLARAFASVNKLVDVSAGTSTGPALPPNAIAPSAEINTLANVLAGCINSVPSRGPCHPLLSYATSPDGVIPADTLQAAINIAHYPTLNVASLFTLAPRNDPFQPQLTGPPTDWTLAIKYQSIGLNVPMSTTIDANGQVWLANSGGNTVTVLAQTGNPIAASPLSGNALSAPSAIAIDATGNAWVANTSGNTLSAFSSSGAVLSGSPFSAGSHLNSPSALAFDALGNLWVGNVGSAVKLSSSGTYLLTQSSGIASPTATAINPK